MTCRIGEKIHPGRIERTKQILGRLIVEPPLTTTFLENPPFWYIHAVVKSVIRSTGFMKGLFTDKELSRNITLVTHKEVKISFLQKVIDMLESILGEKLYATPRQIIRGVEVVNTLDLLQNLGLAAMKKKDNRYCVRRVLRYADNSYEDRWEKRRRRSSLDEDSDYEFRYEQRQKEKEEKMIKDRLARVAGKGRYAPKKQRSGHGYDRTEYYHAFNYG